MSIDKVAMPSPPMSTSPRYSFDAGLDTDRPSGGDQPPSYSPPVAVRENGLPRPLLGLPAGIDFRKYVVPEATLSDDQTTITTTSPALASNPAALTAMLREQAILPPKPTVRIRGVTMIYGSPDTIDFDLSLNLLPLITRVGREQWDYVKVTPPSGAPAALAELDSEGWARRFCEDPTETKSFQFERKVTNWDTEYVEGQLRSVIANTKYKGRVDIMFPIVYSKIVVIRKGPKVEPRFRRMLERKEPASKFEVIESIWPYATAPPGQHARECAVQNEQDWWQTWKVPIRNAILSKHRGWVTVEDWVEATAGFSPTEPEKQWGVHY